MANLEVKIQITDIEEVKAVLGCAVKLVEAIKECNFNPCSGFPEELTGPYRDIVSAIEMLTKNRL